LFLIKRRTKWLTALFAMSPMVLIPFQNFKSSQLDYVEISRTKAIDDSIEHQTGYRSWDNWVTDIKQPYNVFLSRSTSQDLFLPGSYRFEFTLRIDRVDAENSQIATIQIYNRASQEVIAQKSVNRHDFGSSWGKKMFNVSVNLHELAQLEARIIYLCCASLQHDETVVYRFAETTNEVNVATFNIMGKYRGKAFYVDSNNKPILSWQDRKKNLQRELATQEFDIIGLQEVEGLRRSKTNEPILDEYDLIRSALPDYFLSTSPIPEAINEPVETVTFYNSKKFRLMNQGYFSIKAVPTPTDVIPEGQPGHRTIQNKPCVWAHFLDLRTQKYFYFFNTHMNLDFAEIEAEAYLIASKIKEIAKTDPVVLVGDFNADGKELFRKSDGKRFLSPNRIFENVNLFNARDWINRYGGWLSNIEYSSYHGFRKIEKNPQGRGYLRDMIYTSANGGSRLVPISFEQVIITDPRLRPSDHHMLKSRLVWKIK
jgi:endonuclease/exonuclease/phosphatase family metal-dependent hydrolase